ncbi:MFS transporter [Chelatococcus sp. SYSU_G07232]|uniref:MFS transporter n=1 Tax=Chelatococcus albus TaxID=3047466 RepID=A0ABT7AIT7_9HYPH|nr:MFS transporter [Chelatococcus sp. SYSU_G07232]MDJ1158501.1 MFS transporter [Chelatococcus sp. SYSU_G07232]
MGTETARDHAALRLSVLHVANFFVIGIVMPYLPVWLEARGLSAPQIGIVLAVPLVVRVLTMPFVTGLADGPLGAARLIVLLDCGVAAGYVALGLVDGFFPIVLIAAAAALCQGPVVPLSDLLTTALVLQRPKLDYGRIRMWGSAAYLAANLAGGALIAALGAPAIVRVVAAAAPAAAGLALLAPDAHRQAARATGEGVVPADADGRSIALWLMIGASSLVQSSHAMVYTFGSLHWQHAGFGDRTIGLLWAIGVLAEVGLFMLAGGVVARGIGGLRFVVAGGLFASLRFAGMAADPGLAGTMVLQPLHAATFGASHLGAMAALGALVPARCRGRWQGTLTAANGLALAGATLASGPLYRTFGAQAFAAMVPLGLAGAALAVVAARVVRQPQSEGVGG